jgi:hypothetical protein
VSIRLLDRLPSRTKPNKGTEGHNVHSFHVPRRWFYSPCEHGQFNLICLEPKSRDHLQLDVRRGYCTVFCMKGSSSRPSIAVIDCLDSDIHRWHRKLSVRRRRTFILIHGVIDLGPQFWGCCGRRPLCLTVCSPAVRVSYAVSSVGKSTRQTCSYCSINTDRLAPPKNCAYAGSYD